MRILLVRHGPAVDPYATSTDEARWLTEPGRRRVRRVAEALTELELEPAIIFTSPLVRAVQTAEILASAQRDFAGPIEVVRALAPEQGSSAQALAPLERLAADALVFVVGHEPKIRSLAGHLSGVPKFPGFQAGAACLVAHDGERGRFEWMMDPETTELARAVSAISG
jgi:phosphohistidine phosphatase